MTDITGNQIANVEGTPHERTENILPIELDMSNDSAWCVRLSWISGTPGSTQQSMQWKHPTSPPLKKGQGGVIGKEDDGPVFWDTMGIVLFNHIDRNQTINGEYYANVRGGCKRQ